MARTRTLTNLIADCRLRADNKNVVDADITEFINQSIARLYNLLTKAYGDEYFEKPGAPFTTQPNIDTYSLPADFFKLTGAYWAISSGVKARMSKYDPASSEQFVPSAGWSYDGSVWYRLQAGSIRFVPTPTGTHTVTLKYIPASVRLVNGGDTFDGYNGFEEFVVLDVAIKLLKREGNTEDAQLLESDKAQIEQMIADLADRDQAEPSCIQDTVGIRAALRWRY